MNRCYVCHPLVRSCQRQSISRGFNTRKSNKKSSIKGHKTESIETSDEHLSLSSKVKGLQEKLEAIDENKLQKKVESWRRNVKKTVAQGFNNIFPATRLQHFREQQQKQGLEMDRDWWIRNIAWACTPPLLLAVVCELLKPSMEKDMERIYSKTNERLSEDKKNPSVFDGSGIQQRGEERMRLELEKKLNTGTECMDTSNEDYFFQRVSQNMSQSISARFDELFRLLIESLSKESGKTNKSEPSDAVTDEMPVESIEENTITKPVLSNVSNKTDTTLFKLNSIDVHDQKSMENASHQDDIENGMDKVSDSVGSTNMVWNILKTSLTIRPHDKCD